MSPETLRQWAGRSLEERCKLFHRRFPELRISLYSLRKIYRLHHIKKKKLRMGKVPTNQ